MTEPADRHAGSRMLWTLVSVAVRVFYRVERVGPPLPDGALLLVANHPNTLLDPALIQTTAGRSVRFLAKSTLFHGGFLSPLVRAFLASRRTPLRARASLTRQRAELASVRVGQRVAPSRGCCRDVVPAPPALCAHDEHRPTP